MPDIEEVFRMATQKVRPDPGALERQNRNQRRRVMKQRAGGYALLAVLVIAGLVIGLSTLRGGGPDTQPARDPATGLTMDQLVGVWRYVEGPFGGPAPLLSFGADGTFAIDNSGLLDTRPVVRGTYALQGDMIILTTAGSLGCPDGEVIKWRAAPPQDGQLTFAVIQGGTRDCAGGGEYTHIRVSPRSPASASITSGGQAEKGVAPGAHSELAGIWLLDDEDHLLRIGRDGTYAIADGGTLVTDPDDVGTVRVEEEGTLTFTSGADSRTCPEGTVTVWTNVLTHLDALAADVGDEACAEVPSGRTSWRILSRA